MEQTGDAGVKRDDISSALQDVLPVLPAVIPFGALFGALAIDAGLTPVYALVASATIFAGASQYVMIDMLGKSLPAWSIVMAVFAVNFRHILYSAAIGRRLTAFARWQRALGFFLLVDPQYAAAEKRSLSPAGLRPRYYFTYGLVLYCSWLLANVVGMLFGPLIEDPSVYGLDFILPLYFLGLVISFRTTARFAPIVLVSALVAVAFRELLGEPWHITLGGLAGVLLAACLAKPNPSADYRTSVEPGARGGS